MRTRFRTCLFLLTLATTLGMLAFTLQYSAGPPLHDASSRPRPQRSFNASSARDVIPALPYGMVFDDVIGRVVQARPELTLVGRGIAAGRLGEGIRPERDNVPVEGRGLHVEGLQKTDVASQPNSGISAPASSTGKASAVASDVGLAAAAAFNVDLASVSNVHVGSAASAASNAGSAGAASNAASAGAASNAGSAGAASNVGSVAAAASNIDSIPMASSGVKLPTQIDSNAARTATRAVMGQNAKQDVAAAAERSVVDNGALELLKKFQAVNAGELPAGFSNNRRPTTGPQPAAAPRAAASGPKEPCPASYAVSGPDEDWFRGRIQQRSPPRNLSLRGGEEEEEFPEILILTPISNAARNLQRYFANLCALTYPHHRISVVLGEDSSFDGTFDDARKHAEILRPHFARVEVIHLRGSTHGPSGNARHMPFYQLARRRHLAAARNQLLFAGLSWGDTGGGRIERVLWMDSDVKHVPVDIVERLTAVAKPIVVPNCLYRRDNGQTDTFDRNTWRETDASRKKLEAAEPSFLMLEGYEPSKRKTLNDLKGEGDVVKIDGVGGCVLLVDAQLHREGLVFPAFTFEHHIETEGLAKMAARLGIEMYGLPSVNVIHA